MNRKGKMLIPAIKEYTIARPGNLSGGFDVCFVPKPEEEVFWRNLYEVIKGDVKSPLSRKGIEIDPYFGYFGYRFHPVIMRPDYFHIGIDMMARKGEMVYPVANAVLEYSGSSTLNGNYILLQHPEIKTEDGFTLHSMYMHLNTFFIEFTLLEKVMRELGAKKLTTKKIFTDGKPIGEVGATGNVRGIVPHLHLQMEFRNRAGVIIAIDPGKALGFTPQENFTKTIKSKAEFMDFYQQHKKNLIHWEGLWDTDIQT